MKAIIALDVYSVSGATFRTTEHRAHMDAARIKAVQAAKEKAILLAAQLDQEVGRAMEISESNVYQSWNNTNAYANVAVSAGSGSAESDGSAFSPGQIKIEAQVTITFSLQ